MHATSPFDGLSAGLRLGIGAGEPDADADALSRVEDWSTVVALARRHGVVSLLVKGLRTDAGPDIEPRLIALHRRTVRRGMRQFQGLKQAADTLAAVGVPCLVLKGLPLSQRIYAHPFVRDPNDIDLLVPPAAFRDAERALCGHGWVRVKPNFPATSARMRWYRRFVSQSTLNGPGGGLDLHHRLSHNPRYFDVPFERLYDGGAVTTIGESGFATLGEDHLFAYLISHGARSLWHRLKWLSDIAALIAGMEPDRFQQEIARCRQAGLEIALAATLQLCLEIFHVGPPADARARPAFLARCARRALAGGDRAHLYSTPTGKAAVLALKPDAGFVLRETAHLVCQVLYDLLRWSLRRTGEQKPRA